MWPHFIFKYRNVPQTAVVKHFKCCFFLSLNPCNDTFIQSHTRSMRRSLSSCLPFFRFFSHSLFRLSIDASALRNECKNSCWFADFIFIIIVLLIYINAVQHSAARARGREGERASAKLTVLRLQLRFWTWKNLELEFLASNTRTQCTVAIIGDTKRYAFVQKSHTHCNRLISASKRQTDKQIMGQGSEYRREKSDNRLSSFFVGLLAGYLACAQIWL